MAQNSMKYTLGKIRRLQQCATAEGKFLILAVDHRGNLRGYLEKAHPDREIGYREMVDFKLSVTAALRDRFSAVLLDPEFGIAQAIAGEVLPGDRGAIVSVEKWGYSGDPQARETMVLPGWGVEKIARLGGAGVKMLLYYHPDAPNAAEQEAVVQTVFAACSRFEIPFFLEPIAYPLDPSVKNLPTTAKRPLVVEAVRRFSPHTDVIKAEFPVNIDDEPDEAVWLEACRELDDALEHLQRALLHVLVGREPGPTDRALPAAAHRAASPTRPRVHDAVFCGVTLRTPHRLSRHGPAPHYPISASRSRASIAIGASG